MGKNPTYSNSYLHTTELNLVREMIDAGFNNEDMHPGKLEKIRNVLQQDKDSRRLKILIEKVNDQITRSAISLVPGPGITATTEFGTPVELDQNFPDPQKQTQEKELYDSYIALANRIQTDIDLMLKKTNK